MAVFSPAGWDTPTWAQATRGGRVPTCRAAAYVADQRLRQRAGPRLPTACGSPACGWGASDLANGIWHPAPRRLFGAILRGHIVTYASDGSSVRTGIGQVLLLEDVAPAKGHITVNPSTDEPCLVHIVQLPG